MASDADEGETTTLSPDDAFATLGNDTRMKILQTLSDTDTPLEFSDLRERVGMRDSGQFNYHLDKLVGHFVRQNEEGYELRQPGKRVIQAVLSGAITEEPKIKPTSIEFTCRFCGAPTQLRYQHERVELYCTECAGMYGEDTWASDVSARKGILGGFPLPPAGIRDRTPAEVLRAASTWGHLEMLGVADDVCPRCSATLDSKVHVCDKHETDGSLCDQCGNLYAAQVRSRCTNCVYEVEGLFPIHLMDTPELLEFAADHGYTPLSDGIEWGWNWEEEIDSVEPFEARFTLTIDGDTLTLTVDDNLNVIDAAII